MTELDPDFIDAGIACAELIADPKGWINRRVETIEMLTQEETRRRVSVDFTLSQQQRHELVTRHGLVVPISVLSKYPRRNFDLRNEGGASVPVLGRADNGALALIALLSAALDAIPGVPSEDVLEMLTADLRQIIFEDEHQALAVLSLLAGSAQAGDPTRKAIWEDARCRGLLTTLASDYVLFAALPPEGPDRHVLKYSYGEDLPLDPPWVRTRDKYAPSEVWWRARKPDRTRFFIDCPGAWRAASFHMEIAIPQELRVRFATLARFPPDDVGDDIEHLGPSDEWVNRAALYAAEAIEPHDDVRAYIELISEREGGATRAALTAVTVALLLWFGWFSGLDAQNPGAAVSLLLAAAAVLSGFAAVTGRHIIVNKIFRTRRRALVLVALCALTGSASLAMEVPSRTPRSVWLVAAIICSLAALRLCWSSIRAAK